MKLQENVKLVGHSILMHDLSIMREKQTDLAGFRAAMERAATILACFALCDIPLRKKDITTPLAGHEGCEVGVEIAVVSILRAGLGMVEPVLRLVPFAKVGHLGMYRDETTHEPVVYYEKLPPGLSEGLTLLVDPMLATGGSADSAIVSLKKRGAAQIRLVSLISAPEGLNRVAGKHPDVLVFTGAIDEKLDKNAFIVPGLGDAGDRYFGTL